MEIATCKKASKNRHARQKYRVKLEGDSAAAPLHGLGKRTFPLGRRSGHLRRDPRRRRGSASATSDQEVAVVAPLLVPAVLDPPVLVAVQITVIDQGDDVATKVVAGSMLVHARLVREEIAVHREGDKAWAVLDALLKHGQLTPDALVAERANLARAEAPGIAGLTAALLAARRRALTGWAGRVLGGGWDAVDARSQAVRSAEAARATVSAVAASHDTSGLEVAPGGVAAAAAVAGVRTEKLCPLEST